MKLHSLAGLFAVLAPLGAQAGDISIRHYDGISDDLLTAGLGRAGLAAHGPPAYADPRHPSAAELRRNAIFNNYRAIVDTNSFSGYGSLYGPQMVAGTEYIAGDADVTLMVQLPDSFDVRQPCIVVGASGGSSGIYGAIATAGEWGLLHGCAVATTDKGTGTGLYTFDDDSVNLRDGRRATRTQAGEDASFVPPLDAAARADFAQRFPYRLASKHAHSQQNPEAQWGGHVLRALAFAFNVLDQRFPQARLLPSNTIVIATGSSNGGGAALRAVEADSGGWIDGVVVAEPQVQPAAPVVIRQGGRLASASARSLFDYSSFAALYQPCAAGSAVRCASLVAKGLLNPLFALPDAYAHLHGFGWPVEADVLQPFHAATNVLVAVNYAFATGPPC